MVTRREPPYPPFATGPMNGPDGSLMPDGIPALRDIDGNVVDSFYTHGGWLRDQMNIDNDLKGLLIRCLADQPAHRPTLQELSTYMARAERMQGWNDDPDDRDWFDRMAGEPADVCSLSVTCLLLFRGLLVANHLTTLCTAERHH